MNYIPSDGKILSISNYEFSCQLRDEELGLFIGLDYPRQKYMLTLIARDGVRCKGTKTSTKKRFDSK